MPNELEDAEKIQEEAYRGVGSLVRCAMVIEALRNKLLSMHYPMPECTGPIYCSCKDKENK